jgi:tetratricopeptide (TPR) repeat protein
MNPRALILSPLLLSFLALGQADSLGRGLELFRQEKYEAALEQFVDARRSQPANASIENFIGITETKLGRIDEANKDYESAINLDPRLAGPHTNLGFNYLSRKQYPLAEKQLQTALALDSTDTLAHYYLAVLYLTTMRGKEAIPHMEPAAALLERDTPAAILAIEACLSSNSPAEAIKLVDRLEAHATLSAEQEHDLAEQFEAAGEHQRALGLYQKAIAADPANPDRYLDCTRLLIDLDRYDEATRIVESGIPLVPDDYPLTIRLGAIAMMQGNRAQAREAYHKAISEHPALALGYVALAQTFIKEGNDQEALKVLTEARTVVPRDFALEYVFGLVSFQLGLQQQAMDALKAAREMSPTVVEPHFQLGLLYMKMQQWKGAREEFEQVLKLDPRNAPTYYQLSRTYQRLGETAKAQEMARQASLLTKTQREDAIKTQELRFGVPSQN